MAKLIVVIGLPGSGKSHHLDKLKQRGQAFWTCHDYQANAHGQDNTDPRNSVHYNHLMEVLNSGHTAAVADIRYCIASELYRFLAEIFSTLPNLELELHYFKNQPGECRKNVTERDRTREQREHEIAKITEYSRFYKIPKMKSVKVYDVDDGP